MRRNIHLHGTSSETLCHLFTESYGTGKMSRYGLTAPETQLLLEKQGNTCALCPRPATHIDHCHATGKVRGVVCPRCNAWLAATEDAAWLKRAADYLLRTPFMQLVEEGLLEERSPGPRALKARTLQQEITTCPESSASPQPCDAPERPQS